jgi:hypothetical protein
MPPNKWGAQYEPATLIGSLWFLFFMISVVGMQTKAPTVTLDVTLPNGETRQVSATAGEQITVKLPDDTEFGFRSTVRETDSSRVEVTIVKIGSPDEQLGIVEATVGASAIESKTTPVFKIAVLNVNPPDGE